MLLPCQSVPVPAQPLEFLRPALVPYGSALVYSNNPETIRAYPDGGVLYETGGPVSGGFPAQPRGSFRVFYHHVNGTGEPTRLVVVVTNPNPYAVTLLRIRAAGGAGPFWVGVRALMDFLAQAPGAEPVGTVEPGGQAVVVEHDFQPGALASGYADFTAVAPAATLGAPVIVSVLTRSGDLPASVLVPNLPLHPLNPSYADPATNTSGPVRATARSSSRLGLVVLAASPPKRIPVLQVAARVRSYRRNIQPDGQPLPGEYELATDYVDGGIPVYINGNYGVDYTFRVAVIAPGRIPFRLAAGCPNEWCTAGTTLVTDLDGAIGSCYTASPVTLWPYAELPPAALHVFTLRASIPGGSCAPARHFLWVLDAVEPLPSG